MSEETRSYIEECWRDLGFTNSDRGTFYYTDRTGSVSYRKVKTDRDDRINCLAVFTGKPEEALDDQVFISFVSRHYKFEGNDKIRNEIIHMLQEGDINIKEERIEMGAYFSFMMAEYVLGNPTQSPEQDDIFPMITVMNSYDGRFAKSLQFGLSIYSGNNYYSVRLPKGSIFGRFRQIHSRGAKTFSVSVVSNYMERFNTSINSIIESSINKKYTEDDITNTVAMLEEFGKRRSAQITDEMQNIMNSKGSLSAWDMFLLIAKYATNVRSLNVKKMMENLAETVLIIPTEMAELIR